MSETFLRLLNIPHKIASGWSWNDSPRHSLSKFDNDLPNELGFRGQSINYEKNDYVVVLLGDSQVEAATSKPDKMPEKLLQKHLSERLNRSVKVFSLAASGWGQDQELLALENYYRKYRADLVLVWATPNNDFWENAFPDRSVTPVAGHLKPTFKLVSNELKGPFYQANFYYKHSAILQLLAMELEKLRGMTIEQLILDEWISNMPSGHEVYDSAPPNESTAGLRAMSQIDFSEKLYEINPEWRYALVTFEDFYDSRSHFSPFLVNRSPRDNYLVDITKKLFARIDETARNHHSKFKVFFLTIVSMSLC